MNVLLKKFGLLSVIAVWGLAACGDDSSSAPVDFGDLQNVASSSSIGVPSSSSAPMSSSDVIGSSSSVVANSSSSESLPASSQSTDECVHMPHFDKSEQVSHQLLSLVIVLTTLDISPCLRELFLLSPQARCYHE